MSTESPGLAKRSLAHVLIGMMALALVAGVAVAVSGDDEVSFTNAALDTENGGGAADEHGRPRWCPPGGPLRAAIHGELLVPEPPAEGEEPDEDAPKSWRTVIFDAGTVVEARDDELTLERPDGEEVTVDIIDETKMREDAELEEGDRVAVIADEDGDALGVMTPPDDRGEGKAARARQALKKACGPGGQGPGGGPQGESGASSPENV